MHIDKINRLLNKEVKNKLNCTKPLRRELLQKNAYRVNSWVPEPSAAANKDLYFGYLNTSP